ncbi:MAG: excisionase family protein [Pseudomonadota bacterium]
MILDRDWVRISKVVERTGLTERAINNYRRKGVWLEGVMWVHRQGCVYIDMATYQKWVEGGDVWREVLRSAGILPAKRQSESPLLTAV